MIAGLIQARVASQRCKNKMLRPFSQTSLFELALEKFSKKSPYFKLYVAVYDSELLKIAKRYPCEIILRTKESAHSDEFPAVFNYLHHIKEENIAFINPCCPFFKKKTFEKGIEKFQKDKPVSMTSVVTEKQFYYHTDGTPINFLDPSSPCTKSVKPVYKIANCFHIFPKKRFMDKYCYWSHNKSDPVFYEVPTVESFDVDTELEFDMAESYFKKITPLKVAQATMDVSAGSFIERKSDFSLYKD